MSGKALTNLGEGARLLPKWRGDPLYPQIIQELRCRVDAWHQQLIPRPGAGDIQQVPFGVVNLFQVRVVCRRLDPCL